jgi:hypothetical protein
MARKAEPRHQTMREREREREREMLTTMNRAAAVLCSVQFIHDGGLFFYRSFEL